MPALRCDNITLGHTWPKLLDNKMRLRLYGAVQNPFVITKYKGLDQRWPTVSTATSIHAPQPSHSV